MLSINRNDYHSGKKSAFRVMARMILCLMLTFALALPMAVPENVYAASTKYTTAQNQSMAGLDITFSGNVINNKQLSMGPTRLQAAGKSKSIKLSWTAVTNPEGIDGYIIVRRNSKTKRWHQIATVGRYKTTYTDKKAKSSKKCYRYSVLAYKNVSGKIMVSGPAGYAAAVTKKNKKNNVYSVTVANPANVTIVMAGSCAQTYLKVPSKAYSKSMRWWSSNDNILKVDTNGLQIHLAHPGLAEALKRHASMGKYIAAVCAGPSVPGSLGLLAGRNVTCFPGWENHLKGAHATGEGVVADGPFLTGRGLGFSIDLALRMIEALEGKEKALDIRQRIQHPETV